MKDSIVGLDTTSNPTFSTNKGVMIYPDMPNVDNNTTIVMDNSHKTITNFAVHVVSDGFELWLIHATRITGNHVDEAELVGTWQFKYMKDLEAQVELIKTSVTKQQALAEK